MEELDKKIKNLITKAYNESGEGKISRFVLTNTSDLKDTSLIEDFINFSLDFLKLEGDNKVKVNLMDFIDDVSSFAHYKSRDFIINISCKGRHVLDVFRSLAHELVHYKQDVNGELNDKSQLGDNNDGVPIENEANSVAGVIMRNYGRKKPDLFK